MNKERNDYVNTSGTESIEDSFLGDYFGDNNNTKIQKLRKKKDQNKYSKECKRFNKDYRDLCHDTTITKIFDIENLYDKSGFKNWYTKALRDINTDNYQYIVDMYVKLKEKEQLLKRCLWGRIRYKYECLKKDERDRGHDKAINYIDFYIKAVGRLLIQVNNKREDIYNIQKIKYNRLKKRYEKELEIFIDMATLNDRKLLPILNMNIRHDTPSINESMNTSEFF